MVRDAQRGGRLAPKDTLNGASNLTKTLISGGQNNSNGLREKERGRGLIRFIASTDSETHRVSSQAEKRNFNGVRFDL